MAHFSQVVRPPPWWQRRTTVVAVVAGVVLFAARVPLHSRFLFLDDFTYFDLTGPHHLSAGDVTRHIHGPFVLFGRTFGLSAPSAEIVLLALFAAAMAVLHKVLVEVLWPGPGPLLVTAVFGTSLVPIGVLSRWPSGLEALAEALLVLVCLLAYVRWFRSQVRYLLVVSVVAFVLALLVSAQAVLVPLYLAGLRALVLEPRRSVRQSLAAVAGEWSQVWIFFAVPVVVYGAVFLQRYPLSLTWPPGSVVPRYLDVGWLRTFLPSVVGVRIPNGRSSTGDTVAVVTGAVLLVAAVAGTVARRRATWRPWLLVAVVAAANVALFGLPALATFGAGVGSVLREYSPVAFLVVVAAAAALFGRRPRRRARFARSRRPAIPVGVLLVVLGAHLALAWHGAGQVAAEVPGASGGAYLRTVAVSLGRIERRGVRPVVVDRTLPDYVAAQLARYGPPFDQRLSQLLPLVDSTLAFDRVGPDLFRVGDDGNLYPVRFAPGIGGHARGLQGQGGLTVTYGQVAADRGGLCVQASSLFPAQVEYTPPAPLGGTGWYLALDYRSDAGRRVPLFVDHGSGYPYPDDRSLPAPSPRGSSVLVDLGDGPVSRLRVDLPAGSRSCLATLALGRVVPYGPSDDDRGAPLAVAPPADTFSRPDNPSDLGQIPGGPTWHPITGGWGVRGGAAVVSAPVARNVAVVALTRPVGTAAVTVSAVREGAGLVFRYQDPADYWYLVAAPSFATWSIGRVVGGVDQVVGNTGLSPVGDGTTVAVRSARGIIDVAVGGVVVRTVTDATLGDAAGVGLIADGVGAASARFANFAATPLP